MAREHKVLRDKELANNDVPPKDGVPAERERRRAPRARSNADLKLGRAEEAKASAAPASAERTADEA